MQTDVQNALSMSQKAINDLSTRHKQLEDRIKVSIGMVSFVIDSMSRFCFVITATSKLF